MIKSIVLPEKINPNLGGQFAPNLGGQFAPNQVVNLLRKWVVNLTVFSTYLTGLWKYFFYLTIIFAVYFSFLSSIFKI